MNSAILSIYKSEILEMAYHDVQAPADGNRSSRSDSRRCTTSAASQKWPSQIPEEPSNTNPGQEKRSL